MSKPFSFGLGASATTQSTSGGLFGSQPATTQPTTSLFGSPAPAAATGGGFGTTSAFSFNKPATTTTTASPFGQTTNNAPSASLFGATKPTTTFSFGASTAPTTTNTTTQSTGFGGFGSFGSTQPTTTQPTTSGFSGFGSLTANTAPATSIFGSTQPAAQQTQPQSSLFSFSNQTNTATTTAPSIFGGSSAFQGLGQQQVQQQQQGINQQNATPTLTDQERLISALVNPHVYNDERDTIISKWNQLQAFYGFGKVFFQNASLEVTKENPFSRFKTVGYSFKPSNRNEDGLVCLIMKQKESVVKTNQKSITDTLHKIFNSDASLTINLDTIKSIEEEKTEVVFYVTQKNAQQPDQVQRIPSLTVFTHLNKQEAPAGGLLSSMRTTPTIKQQLEQLSVENVFPLVGLSEEQIKGYLEATPAGVHPILWDQAKKNNPNPKKLIPVQINGFQDINKRFKLQDKENQTQKEQLSQIVESIEAINSRNKLIKSKIEQFKARNEDLEHRVLKVMINYEIRRKLGLPLQENEKYLLSVLESFQMELNSPINKEIQRQKLNDFAEIIKSYELRSRAANGGLAVSQEAVLRQSVASANTGCVTTKSGEVIDLSNLSQVQKTMRDEQRAIKSLVDIINKDIKDLNVIKSTLFKEK